MRECDLHMYAHMHKQTCFTHTTFNAHTNLPIHANTHKHTRNNYTDPQLDKHTYTLINTYKQICANTSTNTNTQNCIHMGILAHTHIMYTIT